MNWDRRPQPVGLPTGTSDGPSARRAGGVGRRIRRGDVGPHRERGCALEHRASGARPVRKTRTLTTSAARPLSAVMSWNWAGEWALPPSNPHDPDAPSRPFASHRGRPRPGDAGRAGRLEREGVCGGRHAVRAAATGDVADADVDGAGDGGRARAHPTGGSHWPSVALYSPLRGASDSPARDGNDGAAVSRLDIAPDPEILTKWATATSGAREVVATDQPVPNPAEGPPGGTQRGRGDGLPFTRCEAEDDTVRPVGYSG